MKKTILWAVCSLSAICSPGKVAASENDPAASGFEQISPKEIPGNIIRMIDDHWMLITAGDSIRKGAFNTMLALTATPTDWVPIAESLPSLRAGE